MRTAAVLLLLALAAEAEDLVVRVTVGDEPLEGAGVAVQKARKEGPTFRADKFAPDARTDATGQALVQATKADQVLVYVPGYELAVVDGGGEVADVALRPERVFSGRVVDSKGDPIVGASVVLRTVFRRAAAFPVSTGEEGRFHVYGLWFDEYTLWIEGTGFVPWQARPTNVTEEDDGRTFSLRRVATIAGKITDHRGETVAGTEVHLSPGWTTTRTGDDGTYRISGLEPGIEYQVMLPPPWGGQAGPITLAEGEVREGVDVVRQPPVTLRLRVVDAGGESLADVECSIASREIGYEEVTTNAEGKGELRVPPGQAGKVHLEAKDRESHQVEFGPSPPGATHDLGVHVLRALTEIEVRVRLPDGTPPAEGAVDSVPLVQGVARVKGPDVYGVTVPGYPPVLEWVEPPGPVLVTLPSVHWIDGIVLDADGGPVAGAVVTAEVSDVEPVRTDGDGRFRVGPFITGPVEIAASTPTARSRQVPVMLGGGVLELMVVPTRHDLLRGRVLRGDRPVTRYVVEQKQVVDEQGRFEILLPRAARDWVEILAGQDSHSFPLPPEGQELVARLPGGRALVTLAGAGPGRAVTLLDDAGRRRQVARTGDDGRARFLDLAPGVYRCSADGYATGELTILGDGDVFATLDATPQGILSVRAPPGMKFYDDLRQALNPGVHRHVLRGSGAYQVFLEAVRIVEGEETIIDLAPPDGGSLSVRGPPGTWVELELRRRGATLLFTARLGNADGSFRFTVLPPGSYTVRTRLRRVPVEIAPGEAAVLDLGAGAHVLEDRVLLWNGKPAQGAVVHLLRSDDPGRVQSWLIELMAEGEEGPRATPTDLRGRFRFANLQPGEYTCVARLEGYAPATGTATVGIDGTVTQGLPLTLVRSAGRHVRLLGLVGEPLRYVELRVNGRWQDTDALGRLQLHTVPARIDLDLEGFASLRDLEVHAGDEIRLVRGANLVVLSDPELGAPTVRVGGRPWRRLRPAPLADDPVPGRLVLEDLPPGPVEIRLPAPAPAEGEEEAPEPPEPVVANLESGGETTVDLRPR